MSTEFNRNKPAERSELDADTEPELRSERVPSPARAETRSADVKDSPASEPPATRSYLEEQASGPDNERWQRIQAGFVDDPRKSVTEAHQLVGELTQRIVDAFARERDELEHQWSKGGDVSTEDLRVSLQRYRAFFSRLLPAMEQLTAEKKALAAE